MDLRTAAYILCALAWLAVPASAAGKSMYRCGNSYQDTPCEGGTEVKRTGKATTTVSAETQAVDAECTSRGQASLKIVWAREAGATMERQLADAKAGEQRRLVASVYEKRGSAPAIRSQIEAECQAEQDKMRQVQALAAAAAKLQEGLPRDAPASNAGAPQQSAPETFAERQSAAASAASKKATCARLSESMESLRQQQRAGGSTAAMDRMNQQKRNLEAVLRSNEC